MSLIILFATTILMLNSTNAQNLDVNFTSYPNYGICGSKHIVSDPEHLNELRNCSVIDGYLHIILLDRQIDFTLYTFPDLREITQYLLLYRVFSLVSLGKLFPNLILIRGQVLFHDYSLVVYSMPKLVELDLHNLTTISRGYVRISANPSLCYSRTVSWELITGKSAGHHFSDNGDNSCPNKDSCRGCDNDWCWNSRHCQRLRHENCSEECLGYCNIRRNICYRCKNFIENGTCVKKCSAGMYEYPNAFHCVTKERCYGMYNGRGWIWKNKCIAECPKGYKLITVNGSKDCEECGDSCNIVCSGYEIRGFSDAQKFKGCNLINGSVEIQFMEREHDEDVMQELVENLGGVREIMGYLKVFRTPSITSLKFLKNLTTIHGNELLYDKYSVAINEMPNLENLWDFKTKTNLTIPNGDLFFHNNQRLCLDDIRTLESMTGRVCANEEICNTTNGYAARCRRDVMVANSTVLGPYSATITWKKIEQDYKDEFQLEYFLFYLEEPEIDVVTHNARDTCYSKDWKLKTIPENTTDNSDSYSVTLEKLKASTKYAYYVETTYKNSSVHPDLYKEGRSEILYFITEMERPKMPLDLEAYSDSYDSLTLYWNDDLTYKGAITHYLIELAVEMDDVKHFDRRNYCLFPPVRDETTSIRRKNITRATSEPFLEESPNKCNCRPDLSRYFQETIPDVNGNDPLDHCRNYTDGKPNPIQDADDLIDVLSCRQRIFTVIDGVGVDQPEHSRQARNTPFDIQLLIDANSVNQTRYNGTYITTHRFYSTGKPSLHMNFTFNNLTRFTKYVATLAACRGTRNVTCGGYGLVSQRTLEDPEVDDVHNYTLVVLNRSHVEIGWEEPIDVNGMILSYNLEYTSLDKPNLIPVVHCITRKDHEVNNFKYALQVQPEKYGIRIRAISLGMEGNWTKKYEFSAELSPNYAWVWVLGLVIIAILVSVVIRYMWKKRSRTILSSDTVNLMDDMGVRYVSGEDDAQADIIYSYH